MRFFGYIRRSSNWYLHYLDRYKVGVRKGEIIDLKLRNGLIIKVRVGTSDFRTSRSVFIDESYLPPGLSIPEDGIVVDIGAHIGTFTLFAALRATKGRIFSYEPEPSNFSLLKENIRCNQLNHVSCFNMAVAGVEGERQMYYSKKPSTTGGHSLYDTGASSFSVRCTTLAQIMEDNELDRIDFLKLDCEKAEGEILESMSDDKLRRLHKIAMELHIPDTEIGPTFERLESLGFLELPHSKSGYRFFTRISSS